MTTRFLLSVLALLPALATNAAWAQAPARSDRIAVPPVAVALQAVPAVAATPGVQVLPQVQVVPAPPVRTGPLVPLQIEVSISRYQGDKRTSVLPYSVAVNANGERSSLQIGTEVPVANTALAPGAVQTQGPRAFNYRSVGTSINCMARDGGDGRYEVELQIDDNALYASDPGQAAHVVTELPVFRSFRSRNMLLLRDGQSRQYTAATDRVSGESVRIDVTLRVVK
jgi:hypothetical protein